MYVIIIILLYIGNLYYTIYIYTYINTRLSEYKQVLGLERSGELTFTRNSK